MTINPSAKTILCYGDSNTWGVNPLSGQRFPVDKRWPGVMQKALGEKYAVLEEGLSGRTTMYSDPSKPWKNGKTFLLAALHSQSPIDYLLIMLGTNDVKAKYAVDESAIGIGIDDLLQIIHSSQAGRNKSEPKTIVIAPPIIKDIAARQDIEMIDAPRKSALFASRYQTVAQRNNCLFFNAGSVIQSSDTDGYHLDESAHNKLGTALATFITHIV